AKLAGCPAQHAAEAAAHPAHVRLLLEIPLDVYALARKVRPRSGWQGEWAALLVQVRPVADVLQARQVPALAHRTRIGRVAERAAVRRDVPQDDRAGGNDAAGAERHARRGDAVDRNAGEFLEAVWRFEPHPEIRHRREV